MLLLILISLLIAIVTYLIFSSTKDENINDRHKENLILFDSESEVINTLEGLELQTKNKLKEERELLLFQDSSKDSINRVGTTGRKKFFSFTLSFIGLFFILSIYFHPSGLGSYPELQNAKVFESFFNGNKTYRVENTELFAKKFIDYIDLNLDKGNEIYVLAKKLKNLEEFGLSELAYRSLFTHHREDLSGDMLAEFTQVVYFSSGRKFTEQVKELLDFSLLKNPENPVALTMKGLQYLGEKNLDQTIIQWTKAASFISNVQEKEELEVAIEALNYRKNQ